MEHWTKQEFARRVAVDAAATPTAHDIKRTGLAHVAGEHLSAAANEPEPEPEWDRGPLTMPAELTEADLLVPEFLLEGERYSLAQMLASNADSPEFCAWARAAKPGDVFADIQRVECVAAFDAVAADLAEDVNKAARRNALRDRIALEDQVQHLRLIGGL